MTRSARHRVTAPNTRLGLRTAARVVGRDRHVTVDATVSAAVGGRCPQSRDTLAKGLAALRAFAGTILLANGLSKLFGFTHLRVGLYVANLVDLGTARFILDDEVFKNPAGGQPGTGVPGLRAVARLVLEHWGLFGALLTAMELAAGALLVLGLLTRLAALLGLGEMLFLALVYAGSDRWAFEQPHDYVPLVILARVPAGRVWGLGALVRRRRTDPG